MGESREKKDLKVWLKKSLDFEGVDYENLKTELDNSIRKQKFRVQNKKQHDDAVFLEAIYGSKIKSFLIGFIPFGEHFPSGKRFLLKAALLREPIPKLEIQITPYMELFGSEEVGGVTQSFGEKASDEYVGAKKLLLILQDMYTALHLPIPEDLLKLEIKDFSADTSLGILIYPLDSYDSAKALHIPDDKGARWCWKAFFLPEVWFLWHEIWGVSLLAAIPTAAYFKALDYRLNGTIQFALLALILGIRVLLGVFGNQIYYAKHGKWPNAENNGLKKR